jgi:hypothetical protein
VATGLPRNAPVHGLPLTTESPTSITILGRQGHTAAPSEDSSIAPLVVLSILLLLAFGFAILFCYIWIYADKFSPRVACEQHRPSVDLEQDVHVLPPSGRPSLLRYSYIVPKHVQPTKCQPKDDDISTVVSTRASVSSAFSGDFTLSPVPGLSSQGSPSPRSSLCSVEEDDMVGMGSAKSQVSQIQCGVEELHSELCHDSMRGATQARNTSLQLPPIRQGAPTVCVATCASSRDVSLVRDVTSLETSRHASGSSCDNAQSSLSAQSQS